MENVNSFNSCTYIKVAGQTVSTISKFFQLYTEQLAFGCNKTVLQRPKVGHRRFETRRPSLVHGFSGSNHQDSHCYPRVLRAGKGKEKKIKYMDMDTNIYTSCQQEEPDIQDCQGQVISKVRRSWSSEVVIS